MIKYIDVIAKMYAYGKTIPLVIIWEDGKKFEIDKVIDIKKLASTKGGGIGTRYTCKIKGKIKYLFLNNYKWWIELD